MNDYTELKRLADAAPSGPWIAENDSLYFKDDGYTRHMLDADAGHDVEDEAYYAALKFIAAANPAAVLALIAERDQIKAENEALKAKTETYCSYGEEGGEHIYFGDKAAIEALTGLVFEVEALRKDAESYRLLSFCHGRGTLELVRSHHELCAEIRRLKILAGEPVPPTTEEFVGPSPEGPTARIRRKLAALGQGEQS